MKEFQVGTIPLPGDDIAVGDAAGSNRPKEVRSGRVAVPQGGVEVPQGGVAVPQGGVEVPQGRGSPSMQ